MSDFPPLAALFLTHFDDIKGQSIVHYVSLDDERLPAKRIEHLTLPSGLHQLSSDLVCFTHHSLPAVGLFRSRNLAAGSGRGRRMGTVGVVLANKDSEVLFDLREPLERIYDRLEAQEMPFDVERAKPILADVWTSSKSRAIDPLSVGPSNPYDRIKALVDGRASVSSSHPVTYLPILLQLLGPHLIPIYRASLSGKRILIHSSPPLLPLAAFAWCIWAMGIAPDAAGGEWLGNVGLMDLTDMKTRKGGWVATTSDAIYRSHPASYDIFIDFSTSLSPSLFPPPTSDNASTSPQSLTIDPPTSLLPADTPSAPDLTILSTLSSPAPSPASASISSRASAAPTPDPRPLSYPFSDLPLYRSLLLLAHSPSTVSLAGRLSRSGGWWLFAFEVVERLWSLCVGVCEYAVGRGRAGLAPGPWAEGSEGVIALPEGEEDARPLQLGAGEGLLGGAGGAGGVEGAGVGVHQSGGDGTDEDENEEIDELDEDEAVRRGRLVLRGLWHHTYHLKGRMSGVLGEKSRSRRAELSERELRELCGMNRWAILGAGVARTEEGRFWRDLARLWGYTSS